MVEAVPYNSNFDDHDIIVLPGVGNFKAAASKISSAKVQLARIVEANRLLFGICLGYQLLFNRSDEGEGIGLQFFDGNVKKLPEGIKTPHMGWDTLKIIRKHEVLEGVNDNSYVYFAHSFYPVAPEEIVYSCTDYGAQIPSVAAKKNVLGVQFHPERSGQVGAIILSNLVRMARS